MKFLVLMNFLPTLQPRCFKMAAPEGSHNVVMWSGGKLLHKFISFLIIQGQMLPAGRLEGGGERLGRPPREALARRSWFPNARQPRSEVLVYSKVKKRVKFPLQIGVKPIE